MKIKQLDSEEYNNLITKAPFKTFFDMPQWQNFLESEFRWIRFEHYKLYDSLLFSFARAKLLGQDRLASHPFCEYGGLLPASEEIIDGSRIEGALQLNFGNNVKVRNHPYIRTYIRSYIRLKNSGEQGLASFWIEDFSKKSSDDLWQSFRKTLRQEIKKSDLAGLVVEICRADGDLNVFHNLYLSTMKRHKNIPLPLAVFKFFQQSKDAEVYIAKLNDKVVGGSIFLFYEPFIHYFINASDYKLRKYNIGHAILWHVMQSYVGDRISHIGKYEYFDLGGTRKGSSLEVFKRGWGAEEHPIFEVGGRTSEEMSGWKRDVWGVLPKDAMSALSTYALFFKL